MPHFIKRNSKLANKEPLRRNIVLAQISCAVVAFITLIVINYSAAAEPWGERDSNYQWRLCPATQSLPTRPKYSDPDTGPKNVEVRAESSRLTEDGLNHFNGEVEVIRGDRSIAAEVVTYDPRTKVFNAEGRAHIWDAGVLWSGETASYDLENRVSILKNGKFWNKNKDDPGRKFVNLWISWQTRENN